MGRLAHINEWLSLGRGHDGLVLDVGSGNSPHPRADVLVDRYVTRRTSHRFGGAAFLRDRPSVCGDIASLPFADKSFSFAIARHVIEHLDAADAARALTELSRIAQDAAELQIGVQENHVVFGAGDVWLTTRRIDGQFPNYKQLLPETFEYELAVPRLELLDVVRRASVMIQRSTPLQIRFAEGELTVSTQTQDVGEASESLPVAYTGEPLEIGFNAEFLRDGLESVSEDEIILKLISPLRPGLIQAAGDDFKYLIMPIRLAG